MTDREKAIVMAYTGICTLTGTKFAIFHKYIEDIIGRPVQTIELGTKNVRDEIKEKSEADFIALCKDGSSSEEPCDDAISRKKVIDTIYCECSCENLDIDFAKVLLLQRTIKALPPVKPQQEVGQWIEHTNNGMHYIECPKCSSWFLRMYLTRNSYCPNCGAKMQEAKG